MSLRIVLASSLIAVSSFAFAQHVAPRDEPQGTIAVTGFDALSAVAPAASGELVLRSLQGGDGARVELEPSAVGIARVPGGLYSVQWVRSLTGGAEPAPLDPPHVIVVAPGRVTSLRLRLEPLLEGDARLASVEVL
jgi:hypothetical protein